MSRPRILFMPCFFGMPSHFIPLFKLYQRLPRNVYEVAFFLPHLSNQEIETLQTAGFNPQAAYYYSDAFLSHFDIPVLGLKPRFGVVNELAAYNRFSPDLIIDDTNLTTALARQIQWRPRLTIARTGVFDDATRRERFPHSLEATIETYRVPPPFQSRLPRSVDGYFEAEAHLIPGIRSLESLPGLPDAGARAFYCGPLMLDEQEERLLLSDALQTFLDANRHRRLVYVTFGVDASRNPGSRIEACLGELLRRDFAVITNMRVATHPQCFFSAAVPMHYVSSRAALIVHVAGSATYHYPIMHGKPAITIGTQSRDREDIARTLCAKGLSHHLPAPAGADSFHSLFIEALDRFESARAPFDAGLAARLDAYRAGIETTAASFDIEVAIEAALSQGKARRLAM